MQYKKLVLVSLVKVITFILRNLNEINPVLTIKSFTALSILLPALLLTACNSTEPTANQSTNQYKTESLPSSGQAQLMTQIQKLKVQLIDISSLQPELTHALQENQVLRAQLLFAEQQLIESEAQQLTEELADLNKQIKISNLRNQELQNEVKALQSELDTYQRPAGPH